MPDRLLATLRQRYRGTPRADESDWLTFRLSATESADFERRLEQDEESWHWCGDKVKYDWNPPREGAKGEHILRMPSALYELFIVGVAAALSAEIAEFAERVGKDGGEDRKVVARLLRKVDEGGSPTLKNAPAGVGE